MQDPKYEFKDGKIITRITGVPIPVDEPVFVFRARDLHLMDLMRAYGKRVKNREHQIAVQDRIDEIEQWQRGNPDKMKEPDTAGYENEDTDVESADAGLDEHGLTSEQTAIGDNNLEESNFLEHIDDETPKLLDDFAVGELKEGFEDN